MPRMSGSFDFFAGGGAATDGACGNGALGLGGRPAVGGDGNGALGDCGSGALGTCCCEANGTVGEGGDGKGALGVGGNGALAGVVGGGGGCKLEAVGAPVGPVFFGRTTVGADEGVAIVAPKSGGGWLLTGLGGGASSGTARLADP